MVIVTAASDIVLDGPVTAVAVTTTFPEPAPHNIVELPWHPRRHPATQLAKRSAAVCDWLVQLRPSDIQEVKGYVPTKTLLKIVERVAQLNREHR
jgi:hypothetical protein